MYVNAISRKTIFFISASLQESFTFVHFNFLPRERETKILMTFQDANSLAYYNLLPGTVLNLQLKERGGRKK